MLGDVCLNNGRCSRIEKVDPNTIGKQAVFCALVEILILDERPGIAACLPLLLLRLSLQIQELQSIGDNFKDNAIATLRFKDVMAIP